MMFGAQHAGRVLIIAGSDPSGGAGLQADLKTVTALGGYGAAVVTALTVQDTTGVHRVQRVEPDWIADQIRVVLADIGADAVKIGMLADGESIRAAADALAGFTGPIILDPVMVASSGDALVLEDTLDALCTQLIPKAALITPNLAEAGILLKREISAEMMESAASDLLTLGSEAVLLKGGHMEGDELVDILAGPEGSAFIRHKRIATRHTHGTGCTYASAIATYLAQGYTLAEAWVKAHAYVRRAIQAAPGLGAGHGPLGHAAAGCEIE